METQLRIATLLAHILDNQFKIFGRRFGFNALIGIIPGVGDVIATVLSFYIIWVGMQMRLPVWKLVQMWWNVIFNFIFGMIPVIGDYVYFFRQPNMKNVAILQQYAKHIIIEGEDDDKKSIIPNLSF